MGTDGVKKITLNTNSGVFIIELADGQHIAMTPIGHAYFTPTEKAGKIPRAGKGVRGLGATVSDEEAKGYV